MPEVDSISTAATPSTHVDPEKFGLNVVLGRVFQEMLKKPDNDDPDAATSSGSEQVGKVVASSMAQLVSGFGL